MTANPPIQFTFRIGQKITVIPLQLPGVVLGRADRGAWREYRIVYWSDGKRYDDWLLEEEIT